MKVFGDFPTIGVCTSIVGKSPKTFITMRIPMKPAVFSDREAARDSDAKPATLPI